MTKSAALRNIISDKKLSFLMEAHNGLSARIVERAGFEGIWISGLSLSASLGVRDNNELSFTQVMDMCRYINDAVSIPSLLDFDTGYGDYNTARIATRKAIQASVAGVCVEDKLFPKKNSFLDNGLDKLADPEEFSLKIKAMVDEKNKYDKDFVIIARLEEFIAGAGLNEAIRRAKMYVDAGADAVLVHSKIANSSQIDHFMDVWSSLKPYSNIPIVIVPTKYYSTPTQHFRDIGISTVIWANHNIRSCITAMEETTESIYNQQSLIGVEDRIASVKDIFSLQNNDELAEAESKYLPVKSGSSAIVLAASAGTKLREFTDDKPKTLINIGGKPILLSQIESYNSVGIKDITVVSGYKHEAIEEAKFNIKTVNNPNYVTTTEIGSLKLGIDKTENNKNSVFISYGDLLFKRFLLAEMFRVSGDVIILVNPKYNTEEYNEYIFTRSELGSEYNISLREYPVSRSSAEINDSEYNLLGSFAGIMLIKSSSLSRFKDCLSRCNSSSGRMVNLINLLVLFDLNVRAVVAPENSCSDINTVDDLRKAGKI
jgi:phosphoenolpyruvate phosphomutase